MPSLCQYAKPNVKRSVLSPEFTAEVIQGTTFSNRPSAPAQALRFSTAVYKLIRTNPLGITTVAVPIAVDGDSLRIRFDPDPPASLIKDGRRVPIIASQLMADMRTNVQFSPFPEQHIPDRLREMQDCGINLTCTTNMPWLYDDMREPKSNYQGDALKYVLD